VKFVPKDPGPAADNSSGGGIDGFIKEAAIMLAANWVLGMVISLVIALLLGGIAILLALLAG